MVRTAARLPEATAVLIRHHTRPHHRDLRVDIADPDATVADLAEALDPDLPLGPLLVNGRIVAAATPLDRAAIPNGAIVARPDTPLVTDPWRTPWRLTVTAGLDAGRVVPVAPGSQVIGRDADVLTIHDATVSGRHAQLTLDRRGIGQIRDLGSTNGTWVRGRRVTDPVPFSIGTEVRCGAARWVIEAGHPAAAVQPTSPNVGGSRPLHRPPRSVPRQDQSPIRPPAEPPPPGPVSPVGAVAVLGSLAVGAVMVAVLHSWTYALFALLGPVLLVANAIDGRRRRRKDRRRGRRRRRSDLASFRAALTTRRDHDLAVAEPWFPGPARAARVAADGDTTCWERRSDHPDAFAVRVGVGPVPWTAPLDGLAEAQPADIQAVVHQLATAPDGPAGLTLDPAEPVAIVGPRGPALALVRSILVQATVAHGPADLQVALLSAPDRATDWDWCAWLPHTHDPAAGSLLAATPAAAAVLTTPRTLDPNEASAIPTRRLVVVDDPAGLADRRGPVRTLLRTAADPSAALVPIVLVAGVDDVPAACRVVLTVSDDATLTAPPGIASGPVTLVGTSQDVAADVARHLAELDDPEVDDPGRGLPDSVSLTSLLGAERITSRGLGARWRAGGVDPAPRAVLGASAEGPFEIDLRIDGPHVLIAGTTGSGKSELLRTLVASLAANSSPDHLTFVLIDFKGGSAFDACARLPHTTGLVTDLDDHLAARALQCLEAELRHREQRLRDAGVSSLTELRHAAPEGPSLPRLVVVVDEFATLAAELPDFVDSLVGVAQRGRSLGVHLVLATQRPSGSVSENIRANTALRIALRVQSNADSADVIDDPAAAALPRLLPGRALLRLGPGELMPIQTALATTPGRRSRPAPVYLQRLRVATDDSRPADTTRAPDRPGAPSPTDLSLLVDAAAAAWSEHGGTPPRRAWPDPLPAEIGLPLAATPGRASPDAPAEAEQLVIGVADDPARQRHTPFCWRLPDGPLLAVGLPGSGTTTLAATVALAAARTWVAEQCHIHVVDMGAGGLVPLAGLPHVGAVIGPDEDERQRRLYAELAGELARRRQMANDRGAGTEPRRLVILDGLGAFRSRWGDLDPSGTWDRFLEVTAQGPSVGIHTVIAAEGTSSAPHQVVSACRQRLIFRLGERADHGAFGIPASAVPALVPGRAVAAEGPTEVHVARPAEGLAAAVARLAGSHGAILPASPTDHPLPGSVGTLPSTVPWSSLDPVQPGPSTGEHGALGLVLGLSDIGLVPARLSLPPGGHALITGPPRSGRTTALRTLATAASAHDVAVVVVTRSPGEWADDAAEVLDPSEERVASLPHRVGPLLVLVDDADLTADDHRALGSLATDRRPDRHVVAAARADRLRSLYGHWTRELRADRTGLLLVPDPDLDGDLLGARLPRTPSVAMGPGRGWLTGGMPEGFVQVALAR